MLLVPLPFFVTFLLGFVLVRIVILGDFRLRSTWLFAVLITLYGAQSALLGIRWGYGIEAVTNAIAMLAPLLPVFAWLSYQSLMTGRFPMTPVHVLPILTLWLLVWQNSGLVDFALIIIYLIYGVAILLKARYGPDVLSLSRIESVLDSYRAMVLTAFILIGSGLMDIYVIIDFIRSNGQNVGIVIIFAQLLSLLLVGIAAIVANKGALEYEPEPAINPKNDRADAQTEANIATLVIDLFETEKIHKNLELNLRKIARRLSLPDRSISNAINRAEGVSVSQFVNRFRVEEACHLLTHTNLSIIQISLEAGFMSKSNFNREFLRVTGMNPTKWRQKKTS